MTLIDLKEKKDYTEVTMSSRFLFFFNITTEYRIVDGTIYSDYTKYNKGLKLVTNGDLVEHINEEIKKRKS